MKTTNSLSYIFKGISLILLDVITFLILFSAWAIINIPLFPFALTAVLFSLLVVNVLILGSGSIIQAYGIPLFVSSIFTTGLYYLIIMVYTGVVYSVTTPSHYLTMFLIMTLLYIVVMIGLYYSGINHKADISRQVEEKDQVLQVNLRIIEIEDAILQMKAFIEKDQYDSLHQDFERMKERLSASTPIGRITKPIIREYDVKLDNMLADIQRDISTINNKNELQNMYDKITKGFSDIKTLIINREKLIVQ